MEHWKKIKELHMVRRRSFLILLLAEALLLLLGVIGLFGKNDVYEFGPEDMTVNFGSYEEEYGGVYVDGQRGMAGNMVDFAHISLPKGVYRVELDYDTDVDNCHSCEVTDDTLDPKSLRTNGTMLFAGLSRTDFDMWLLRDSAETVVHAVYSGEGELLVSGLTIRRTNALNRIVLFLMLVLFAAIDGAYVYFCYDKAWQIPVKNKNVTFLLGLTVLFASLPLTVDYMLGGGDLGYHLMRVEGIVDGIRAGQFSIRISPEWQQGYGYASPIFYGETVLYLAALFRLIGFTVTTSYRLFHFVVVVSTVLIAYQCFKRMFRDAYVGVFCSMLYSLSVYRIYKTWLCGSWGECFGVMFLPLIAYGFYRVFTQDIREESYQRSWLPLTVGFSMLIQSHLLTCEMVGAFTILLCLVLWRRVMRLRTFVVLAKTVIYSILLSAWFLVPFGDYMLSQDLVIHHVSGRMIQGRGLYPAHLFFTFFVNGGTVFFDQQGMYDSAAMGVGIALVTPLCVLAYLFFAGRMEGRDNAERALGKIAGWFAVLAMIMSLSLFPWDRIQSISGVTATLVSSIQFPNRFLTIANVCLTAVAGLVAKHMAEHRDKLYTVLYFGGMVFLTAVGSLYLTDSTLNTSGAVRVYNHEGMGTGYISGAEYLPYGADAGLFTYHDPVCTGGLAARDYEKQSLGAEVYLEDAGGGGGTAAFPLLYYKGYHAWNRDTGEELACYGGENFEVTVDIPPHFEGSVEVRFVSPWYWRAGEAVTLLTILAMAGFFLTRAFIGRGPTSSRGEADSDAVRAAE